MTPLAEKFFDWVPVRVYTGEIGPLVDWCYMDGQRFTHPFFEDTIQQRLWLPFNVLFRHQTNFDVLEQLFHQSPGLEPTGLIFHMSRCGSTLVSQMLASLERNIVISEAPPIDSVLSIGLSEGTIDEGQRRQWLKWIISALGRPRTESEERYFIKFDSWNTLDINLITGVFPDVPSIFLYREPVEVIVSHMRQRGSQMIPGVVHRLLPDMDLAQTAHSEPELYCAKVLSRICNAAIEHATRSSMLLVNYDQLPGAVTGSIAEHFGLSLSDEEIERMTASAKHDAKSPSQEFAPDRDEKQKAASPAARKAAEEVVDPLYRRLEDLRLNDAHRI